ncbi:MAG: peptide ABC transporter ATP-binding protein [Candidatus Wallbacteria bacterium HGW-Wallbacteria-1]|jgi:oligopeptide/dipeptide ABC transporter ATP-binding protein|uniref:Peptide ABC transporter ATP-binding protein n=1 Tax=Candidatus Wallbacteria bacterium HGW-Wallbacteria-1 TaxID=2013854 RepID=A0A2N1PT60_9BACT|nr:MAG: peptide ABC transporter ATP-binding protein [Candidatus Wallbacteria bacterium HGW-Wallbacteria-1]
MSKKTTETNDKPGASSGKEILRVRNLKTHFRTEAGIARAVDGVDFHLYEGEVLGLVGESGSGKSVTSLSIMQLIPDPPGRIVDGEIIFKGSDLLEPYHRHDYEPIRRIRGNQISMIFQEPMTSLNPVFTIGFQVAEPLIHHFGLPKIQAYEKAAHLLDLVGIPDPKKRLNDYPHQFSGGMRQRVMIAMALACDPSLLIADEPTTALDVTIQAQILELMLEVKSKTSDAAILLITHDLAVVAETCQRVVVMYCGKVQEIADIDTIFHNPGHPYTQGLLHSIPKPGAKASRLETIEGTVPSLFALPKGCSFCTRCPQKIDKCPNIPPELVEVAPDHFVRCHLAKPMAGNRT